MKIDFKGILEGAWNSIFIKDSIEKVHKERLEICNTCEYNSEAMKAKGFKTIRIDYHCTLCGCNLDMKTRCMSCECPVKKWEALMSEVEDTTMMDKLNKDGNSNSN